MTLPCDVWNLVLWFTDRDIATIKNIRLVNMDLLRVCENYLSLLLKTPLVVTYGYPFQWWIPQIDTDGSLERTFTTEKRHNIQIHRNYGRLLQANNDFDKETALRYTARQYYKRLYNRGKEASYLDCVDCMTW